MTTRALLLLTLLGLLAPHAFASGVVGVPRVQGVPGGDPLQADATASGTVNAACADGSINSCAGSTTVAVSMAGAQGFGFIVPAASTLISTLKVDCSWDNGTTWVNQNLLDANGTASASLTTASSTTYSNAASAPGGARQCRVRAATVSSGSATITAIATAAASIGNAIQGIAGGVAVPMTLPDVTASGTLSTACSTGASCAGTAVLSIALAGMQTVGMNVTSISSPLGFTVVADCSYDGGTTWQLTASPSTTGVLPFETALGAFATSLANAALTAGSAWTMDQICEGASHARVRVAALTSGTLTLQLRSTAKVPTDPSYTGVAGALGTPPYTLSMGAADAVTSTTLDTLQVAATNVTPASAKFLLTLNSFFRSAVQAGSAGNVGALSIDSTNSGLNIRLMDAATYTGAQVAGTNSLAASSGVAAWPAVARSAVSAVTSARLAALSVDTVTGMQLFNLSDGAAFLKASVLAQDTTAALNGLEVLPAIAKAGPAATTAARGEMEQLDTVSGGIYATESATSNNTATSQSVVSANTATGVKASAGNVYGVSCVNTNAAVCYLQFYNSNAPTCGTSVTWSIAIPTSGVTNMINNPPMANHSTGIGVCMGTTPTGATACTTANTCTVFYK